MVLKVQNLEISLAQKVLIQNLCFELKAPSFVAIIGHNGSGKTSLLKSLVNLLPYRGEIFLSSTPSILGQKNTIHFDIEAKELAVMGKFSQKKTFENYTIEDFKEVENAFDKLGIRSFLDKNVLDLSGGEQQMVWLAQILVQNKDILLLDEPTQYLDIHNRKKVFMLLNSLIRENKKTVLCVTHDILNLYSMEGYLLNLSSPNPRLEILSKDTLDKHLALLEEKL